MDVELRPHVGDQQQIFIDGVRVGFCGDAPGMGMVLIADCNDRARLLIEKAAKSDKWGRNCYTHWAPESAKIPRQRLQQIAERGEVVKPKPLVVIKFKPKRKWYKLWG